MSCAWFSTSVISPPYPSLYVWKPSGFLGSWRGPKLWNVTWPFWIGLDWRGPRIRFLVTIGDPFSLIPLEGRNEDVLVGHFGRLKFSGCVIFAVSSTRSFCDFCFVPEKTPEWIACITAPFTVHRATLPDKFHWLALLVLVFILVPFRPVTAQLAEQFLWNARSYQDRSWKESKENDK